MNALIAFLTLFPGVTAPLQSPRTIELNVDGVARTALLFESRSKGPQPIVFAFHGHGGNSRQAARSFAIHENWPEAHVVYPQGLPSKGKTDPEGKKPGWQQQPSDLGERDLKFFDALYAHLKDQIGFDSKKVFAMGHSNGGRFTYVLWASRGDKFAGMGPSGSPALLSVRQWPAKPAFVIAGEKDAIVPYAGQKLSIDALKRLLGVTGEPKTEGYAQYFTGRQGMRLGTYVHPGGHEFPAEGGKRMAAFFREISQSRERLAQ
ncbi:MAG: hypothetical protein CNCCGFBP_02169 [Fimbriimonadaceae bacterium]|nr:hypothetical protein [Fimbriimonadaceae bacterium]